MVLSLMALLALLRLRGNGDRTGAVTIGGEVVDRGGGNAAVVYTRLLLRDVSTVANALGATYGTTVDKFRPGLVSIKGNLVVWIRTLLKGLWVIDSSCGTAGG